MRPCEPWENDGRVRPLVPRAQPPKRGGGASGPATALGERFRRPTSGAAGRGEGLGGVGDPTVRRASPWALLRRLLRRLSPLMANRGGARTRSVQEGWTCQPFLCILTECGCGSRPAALGSGRSTPFFWQGACAAEDGVLRPCEPWGNDGRVRPLVPRAQPPKRGGIPLGSGRSTPFFWRCVRGGGQTSIFYFLGSRERKRRRAAALQQADARSQAPSSASEGSGARS